MDRIVFAFDKQTARSFDADGRMRVKDCILSTAEINPYFGREIVDKDELGLDDNKVYELYRDPEELGHPEAVASFQGVPLMIKHVAQTAEEPRKEYQAGSVYNVRFDGERLRGDLLVSDGRAIELIEGDELSDLSCGYRYKPVMRSGSAKGKTYDGRMTQIRGNHVALVDDGRASGAHVADSAFRNPQMPNPSLQGENTMPDLENGQQPGAAPLPGSNDAGATPGAAAPAGDPMAQVGAALKQIAESLASLHQLVAKGGQSEPAAPPAEPNPQQAQGATDTAGASMGPNENERDGGPRDPNRAMDDEHAEDSDDFEQHARDADLTGLVAAVPGEEEGEGAPPSPAQSGSPAAELLAKGGQQGTPARGETTPHTAMDANSIGRYVQAAVERERSRARATETAKREVRGVLGEVYGMDSASAIYREALAQVGVDVKQIPKGAARSAWQAYKHASAAASGARPVIAMDAAAVESTQNALLAHLNRISVKG